MSTRSGFTPEEWTLIVEAPTTVATLVAMASFDMGDMIKEFGTLERRSAALAQELPGNPLIGEIAAELKARSEAKQQRLPSPQPSLLPSPHSRVAQPFTLARAKAPRPHAKSCCPGWRRPLQR